MKKDYEEKINSIEAAMKSGTGERVTPGEINKLRTELFKMNNFGPNLRSVTVITSGIIFVYFFLFRDIFNQMEVKKQEAAQVSKVMIPPVPGSFWEKTYEAGRSIYRKMFQGNGVKNESDEVFDDKLNNNEDKKGGNKKKRKGGNKKAGKNKKKKV